MTWVVLFNSLEHIFTTIKTKFEFSYFCIFYRALWGTCKFFRPPVQGGSCELISKFLPSMTLYKYPSYFKSEEINSRELSPLPNPTHYPSPNPWTHSEETKKANNSNHANITFAILHFSHQNALTKLPP